MVKITRFDIVRGIADVHVLSVVVHGLAKYKSTQEELEEYLAEEIEDVELQQLISIAQQEGYPLSFDGLQ